MAMGSPGHCVGSGGKYARILVKVLVACKEWANGYGLTRALCWFWWKICQNSGESIGGASSQWCLNGWCKMRQDIGGHIWYIGGLCYNVAILVLAQLVADNSGESIGGGNAISGALTAGARSVRIPASG